jgi:hypothetical protein
MVFIMPKLVKPFSRIVFGPDQAFVKPIYFLIFWLFVGIGPAYAEDFSAKVRSAGLKTGTDTYDVYAEIAYQLSPTANEALSKGVPLAWEVSINISHSGWLFDTLLYQKKLAYYLQFHALLNQYEVKNPSGQLEMFLSLNAALNYMAGVHLSIPQDTFSLSKDANYQLAIQSHFNREFLPVPLRPIAYLSRQWYLSSDWYLWPIQK